MVKSGSPFFDLCLNSFTMLYNTGTTSIVKISIVIPPKTGIAIGTIISEPLPVDVSTDGKLVQIAVIQDSAGGILDVIARKE